MTQVKLENENLVIIIAQKGAELLSVIDKADKTQYIWQADPEVWGRHAPVLFPIVGKLKENRYEYKGTKYHMNQHGFARDLKFEVTLQEKDLVSFSLSSSEKTLDNYPFPFQLEISYTLTGYNLKIDYNIRNLSDTETMPFSIGAHPGFNLPLDNLSTFDEYSLEILPDIPRKMIPVNEDVLLNLEEHYIENKNKFDVERDLFKNGVVILETPGKTQVNLRSNHSKKQITVSYENMPYLGLWSTYPLQGDFLCIEPWCGIADQMNTDFNFSTKIGINNLEAKKTFSRSYCLDFSDRKE